MGPGSGVSGNAAGTGTPSAMAAVTVPVQESTVSDVAQGKEKAAVSGEATERHDITRLADAARCEVYVCY